MSETSGSYEQQPNRALEGTPICIAVRFLGAAQVGRWASRLAHVAI